MTRRSAAELAAHQDRLAAIDSCPNCDPCGWKLGPDGTPIEPARRCDHGAPTTPLAVRDITEPIHQPDMFDTQEPQP